MRKGNRVKRGGEKERERIAVSGQGRGGGRERGREREKTARTMWEKRKLIRSGSTLRRGPRP